MTATTCLEYTTRRHTVASPADCPGPALGLGGGRYLPLNATITRIGRGDGADLQLDDQSVSHRHALLIVTAVGVVLLDDRSADGTFVNGERTSRAVVEAGDEIAVGRVTFTFVDAPRARVRDVAS